MFNQKIKKNYTLENLKSEHIDVIQTALDFYSKIKHGQFGELLQILNFDTNMENVNEIWEKINKLKILLFPDLAYDSYYKDKNQHINITENLTYEDISKIQRSLDFYSRIQCGQLEELLQIFLYDNIEFVTNTKNININEIRMEISRLKALLFPDLTQNSHYGISHEKTPENAKIAYDIIQVIRNKIAWDNNPKGGIQLSFDPPMKTSKSDFINVKITKENHEIHM